MEVRYTVAEEWGKERNFARRFQTSSAHFSDKGSKYESEEF
jgi:hypothetical protein